MEYSHLSLTETKGYSDKFNSIVGSLMSYSHREVSNTDIETFRKIICCDVNSDTDTTFIELFEISIKMKDHELFELILKCAHKAYYQVLWLLLKNYVKNNDNNDTLRRMLHSTVMKYRGVSDIYQILYFITVRKEIVDLEDDPEVYITYDFLTYILINIIDLIDVSILDRETVEILLAMIIIIDVNSSILELLVKHINYNMNECTLVKINKPEGYVSLLHDDV